MTVWRHEEYIFQTELFAPFLEKFHPVPPPAKASKTPSPNFGASNHRRPRKGQRAAIQSAARMKNLCADERAELKELLAANRRPSVVHLLKDAFKHARTYTHRKCANKYLCGQMAMATRNGIADY
jgi:hypothetical protein